MSISFLQLFQILKQKLGEQEAQTLVEFVKTEVRDELEAKSSSFATKEDLIREVSNAKIELIKWTIGTGLAIVGLIVGAMKLFL